MVGLRYKNTDGVNCVLCKVQSEWDDSQSDRLYRYATKEERQKDIDEINTNSMHDGMKAITTRAARKRFNLTKFDYDPFDDYYHDTPFGEYITPRY